MVIVQDRYSDLVEKGRRSRGGEWWSVLRKNAHVTYKLLMNTDVIEASFDAVLTCWRRRTRFQRLPDVIIRQHEAIARQMCIMPLSVRSQHRNKPYT